MRNLIGGIVLAGIIIALIGSAAFLWKARTDRALDGEWTARMLRPGKPPSTVRFTFQVAQGSTLTGTVDSVPFADGALGGGTLRFRGADGIAWTGAVRGREIDLVASGPDGLPARGVARKRE